VATVASIAATFRVNDLLPRELQQTLNSLAVNFSTSSAVENNRTIILEILQLMLTILDILQLMLTILDILVLGRNFLKFLSSVQR
jgi:hypothetical protein